MPHIHERIDFTVEVFIVFKNKVLLRKHDKYNMWLSVGGHIELDEDPNQAAIREVKEEIGLDIRLFNENAIPDNGEEYTELIPPIFMNRHRINPTHEHVTLTYFAKSYSDKMMLSDKEKSEDCRWFTQEQLESSKDIKEHVKFYALKSLDALKE